MGNVVSDTSRRCTEHTLVFIRMGQDLCCSGGGTADVNDNNQDFTHEIAAGGHQNCVCSVLATFAHSSVSVSQKHFKDLNV